MKSQKNKVLKIATICAVVGILVFTGFSFKSSDPAGQIMTMVTLQSKGAMKGDRDLCLVLNGEIVKRVELPSAFSTKSEDIVTTITTVNKVLNELAKDGWKIVSSDAGATLLSK